MAYSGYYLNTKPIRKLYGSSNTQLCSRVGKYDGWWWYTAIGLYCRVNGLQFYDPTMTITIWSAATSLNGTLYSMYACWYVWVSSAVGSGSGSTSGGGSELVAGKESCKLTATPSSGWRFSHWSTGSTANPYTYTPTGTNDVVVYATFVKIQYIIELTSKGNGKVSIDGSTPALSASKSVNAGDFVSMTAIGDPHYRFVEWHAVVPSYYQSAENPWTYKPSLDRNWNATFVQSEWKVSVSSEGNGSAYVGYTTNSFGWFGDDVDVMVRAQPELSARTVFDYWKNSAGEQVSTDSHYTFRTSGSADVNLIAVFKEKSYTIRAERKNIDETDLGVWGTVSMIANGATQTTTDIVGYVEAIAYWTNNPVILVATPKTHATFKKWKDSDNLEYSDSSLSLTYAGYTSKTFTAYFEQSALYALTLLPNGTDADGNTLSLLSSQGMGSGDDADKYYGGYIEVKAIATTGWRLSQWGATGKPTVVRTSPGFDSVWRILLDRDTTVTATFELNQYNVLWSVDTPSVGHGSIDSSGSSVFTFGSEVVLQARPNIGEEFRGWYTPEGSLITLLADTTITVSTDVTYIAKFGNDASVSMTGTNTGNSSVLVATPVGSSAISVPFTYGQQVTFSVEIAIGDYFLGWYSDEVLQASYGDHVSIIPTSAIDLSALISSTSVPFYVKLTNEASGFGLLAMVSDVGEKMTEDSMWKGNVETIFGEVDLLNDIYFKFNSVDTVAISSTKTISTANFKEFLLIPRMVYGGVYTDGTPTPITKSAQAAVVLTRNCTLEAKYYSATPTTITVDFVIGSDYSMGAIGFDRSGTNEIVGISVRSDFTQGVELFIVAIAKSGYKFSGWYQDSAGTDTIEDAMFEHQITVTAAPKTYYAKFTQDTNAIYEWEGELFSNKRIDWESKRFVNPRPFSPSSACVDADQYPVKMIVKMSSQPDSSALRTIVTEIRDQNGRRLQLVRPEKYITVSVSSIYAVNSVTVSTSMEGLKQ